MISLRNLKKQFGAIVAVEDLSLEIAPGEIFGLLGPNGAGKTTTVNLAIGVLTPDSGTVNLAALGPPSSSRVRAKIGVAPQALALYENLSGEENLRFFGRLQGLGGRTLADRVAWSLEFVELGDRRRDRVKTYSGGMKRRLTLARSLVNDPEVIFMDEPTTGLDPQARHLIWERMKTL